MNVKDTVKQEMVEKIIYYTQQEGLKDSEVADIMGCSRATVNRLRNQHQIPTADLRNRKDKEMRCESCHHVEYIRRKERRKRVCVSCSTLQE